MMRLRRSLGLALLGTLCWCGSAAAQGPVGRVTGTVRDDTGKPVPRAMVTATNPTQAPATFTATTDDKGRFGILGLRRGAWTFAFVAPGFQTTRAAGEVQTGRPNPPLNVTLLRGQPAPAGPSSMVSGTEIQALIDSAEAAAAAGDPAAAISGYRQLLVKIPALTSAYLRIGALLEQQGDATAALAAYRELARVEPDNPRAAAAVSRLTRPPQ